ncbi:MAG: Bax inhibitor-1/YccA family protein [Alphaproteobacteria bacterium]|nr:MAG: Bax inhibitor-1/YccA family protein [Alphaproteobacteria bacterium]
MSPVYAVFEGVFLGAISRVFETLYPGIAMQAILGTGVVTGVMLVLYRFRVIRATPMFTKVVVALTLAAAVMYGVAFIAMMFGAQVSFLRDASPLGIGLSLFMIGLAASNLILDFDLIEKGEASGRPKAFEWYGAFALLVTVAWLYVEVLRLLSRLNRR